MTRRVWICPECDAVHSHEFFEHYSNSVSNPYSSIPAFDQCPGEAVECIAAPASEARSAFLSPRQDESGGWFSWNHKYAKGTERILIIREDAS